MLKRIVLSIFMLTSVSISILAQQQDTLVVSRDGTGKYRTIQEAVEAESDQSHKSKIYIKYYFVISRGNYRYATVAED